VAWRYSLLIQWGVICAGSYAMSALLCTSDMGAQRHEAGRKDHLAMMVSAFVVALALVISATILAAGAGLIWLINSPFKIAAARRRKQFMRTSVAASAIILTLETTRGEINRHPVGRMTLAVHPPDPSQLVFETQVDFLIPLWRRLTFHPGQMISVRYDPAHPDAVELENVTRADAYWGWRIISQALSALFPASTANRRRISSVQDKR
jgi:hypothetical protein